MNIDQYCPQSGRFLKEDGTYINIADALGGVETGQIADIEKHAAHSGRFIKEDGTVINIAESIGSGGGGGGSSDDSATPIIEEYNGQVIQSSISADRPLQGLKLFATTKQVTTTGAQLFDASLIPTTSKGGATVTNNGDGSFTISGEGQLTGVLAAYYTTSNILKPGAISINRESVIRDCAPWMYFQGLNSANGTVFDISNQNEKRTTVDITEEMIGRIERCRSGFYGAANSVITPATFSPMVYQDGNGTYEPYTGGKPSPSLDYPQEIQTISDFVVEVKNSMGEDATPQTLNIAIPDQGFYGIPVKSGGNYTDSTGQQWICDEFDFTNKKFIKRTGRIEFDGSSDENWILNSATEERTRFYINVVGADGGSTQECLCNRAIYGTTNDTDICFFTSGRFYINVDPSINSLELWRQYLPTHELDVIYQLATPIEYDLTNEQVEQFKKLKSYYGTTYIDNDAVPACNMTAEIIADTKLYIDSKFTTLAGQILEMGV